MSAIINDLLVELVKSLLTDAAKDAGKAVLKSVMNIDLNADEKALIDRAIDQYEKAHANNSIDLSDKTVETIAREIVAQYLQIDMLDQRYPTEFAARLDYVFCLMGEAGIDMNIPKLSDLLGFSSPNLIKQYYIDSKEPEFDFVDQVAGILGANADYLSGKVDKHPFANDIKLFDEDGELLFRDRSEMPKEIYPVFILDSNDQVEEFITVARFNEYKYICYRQRVAFVGNLGMHGERLLKGTYAAIKALDAKCMFADADYIAELNLYNRIYRGDCHPGVIRTIDPELHNTFDILVGSIRDPHGDDVTTWDEKYESYFPQLRDRLLHLIG